MYAIYRMGSRPRPRKAHGCFWNWFDPWRLRIATGSILGSAACHRTVSTERFKAAIRSFARTWTNDLKERRIHVNAISPGTIDTPGLNDLLASSAAGQERVKMISSISEPSLVPVISFVRLPGVDNLAHGVQIRAAQLRVGLFRLGLDPA